MFQEVFMMKKLNPAMVPPLDREFQPAVLASAAFLEEVKKSGSTARLLIAIERGSGMTSIHETPVFAEDTGHDEDNNFFAERLVKSLLWIYGGWKVTIAGSGKIADYLANAYSPGQLRAFDADFMSRVYEKPFTIISTSLADAPSARENAKPVGRHLDGCRIGFDAGGSDRKVSAVVDGEVVYSEEVIWHPKVQTDPDYHYNEILTAVKTAASKMPRVDAMGVSSAGVFVDNRVMVASLFLKVPRDLFDAKVKDIYLRVAEAMGNIPVEVANDGDVTALAGAIDLDDNSVLGIAMGTSEAGGYVDPNGNITGWLNELAFVPVDYNPASMVDEWSGDFGCGVKYFSQDAVIKLAPAAGIHLDATLTPAEKLKVVQDLHDAGDRRADGIFETIGIYLGYAIANYARFYDIRHVLVLGRVTSGKGGELILAKAHEVLDKEFPELAARVDVGMPDESNKRVGQSIAAASLPDISKERTTK